LSEKLFERRAFLYSHLLLYLSPGAFVESLFGISEMLCVCNCGRGLAAYVFEEGCRFVRVMIRMTLNPRTKRMHGWSRESER
jgi:hypothetical protein